MGDGAEDVGGVLPDGCARHSGLDEKNVASLKDVRNVVHNSAVDSEGLIIFALVLEGREVPVLEPFDDLGEVRDGIGSSVDGRQDSHGRGEESAALAGPPVEPGLHQPILHDGELEQALGHLPDEVRLVVGLMKADNALVVPLVVHVVQGLLSVQDLHDGGEQDFQPMPVVLLLPSEPGNLTVETCDVGTRKAKVPVFAFDDPKGEDHGDERNRGGLHGSS